MFSSVNESTNILYITNDNLMIEPNKPIELKLAPGSEAERYSTQIMKKAKSITIRREEDFLQNFWNLRKVNYNSQLGNHYVYRFQPQLLNLLCCWPCKKCCTNYQVPPFVQNVENESYLPYVHISGYNSGFISVGGIVLGTYNMQKPGLCQRLFCFAQPTIIITKMITQEQFTVKVEDNFLKSLQEIFLPFCSRRKNVKISKGSDVVYTRSAFQGLCNALSLNCGFYNNMEIDFGSNFSSDVDKILLYGAFIFLQENTNCSRGCPL